MYRAFQNAEKQCAKWHDYEMHVAPYDKDKPIYYEFTACPAAEFAIKHGLTDIYTFPSHGSQPDSSGRRAFAGGRL